jgi:DNA-binding Lrp family transcriptional regulator
MKEHDFLAEFLGNTVRARLVRVFIRDAERSFILKDVAKRVNVSLANAEEEMKSLEKLGIVKRGKSLSVSLGGTLKKAQARARVDTWTVNSELKEFSALSRFVHEVSPMRHERIVESLKNSGKLAAIILSGNFLGDPTRPTDMLIAGDGISEARLEAAIKALEPEFGREIRYTWFTTPEFRYRLTVQDRLVRDTLDFPHLVLLDRARLL